ncbi:MAG: hypothetical protein CME16_03365 [Gemmatimonadetes bacterium]|nr:hypothetical protein [Gemmatimonadota bacterium]
MFPSFRSKRILALGMALGCGLGVLGAKVQEVGVFTVKKSVENFRAGPDGQKLGTLLEGAEIERISQEGKWIRFRVEGWIWGPSLAGFEEEKEELDLAKKPPEQLPLQEELPRIKRMINDTYGVFYGIHLDKIARRLVMRYRIRGIDREDLQHRQMAVQHELVKLLQGKLDFASVRIENNRPDGSGQVGIEIAETRVEDILRYARGEMGDWRVNTRISRDGGKTWGDEKRKDDEKTNEEEVVAPQGQG